MSRQLILSFIGFAILLIGCGYLEYAKKHYPWNTVLYDDRWKRGVFIMAVGTVLIAISIISSLRTLKGA